MNQIKGFFLLLIIGCFSGCTPDYKELPLPKVIQEIKTAHGIPAIAVGIVTSEKTSFLKVCSRIIPLGTQR